MSDLKSLREELRQMRKEKSKPVSKMGKKDITAELERLKVMRAETPAVASMPSAPMRKSMSAVETIQEAKAKEFPVMPMSSGTKKGMERKTARKAYEPKKDEKKKSKIEAIMKMLEESSDEE